jgi:hypothetical protein
MIILTFDTDYMTPEAMDSFVLKYSALPKSTFFAHPRSENWSNNFHEVNEHPVIENLENYSFVPNRAASFRGRGVRSHSCVSSHLISLQWAKAGLLYQSQETRWNQQFEKPERTAWGIFELPISYMDNQDIWMEENWPGRHTKFSQDILNKAVESQGAYIFDFHPLHIALNTSSVQDYAEKKNKILGESASPWELTTTEYGTRDFFEELLQKIEKNQSSTATCIEFVTENLDLN